MGDTLIFGLGRLGSFLGFKYCPLVFIFKPLLDSSLFLTLTLSLSLTLSVLLSLRLALSRASSRAPLRESSYHTGLVQSPEDVARCVDLRPSSRARREYVPGALNKAFAAAPKAFTRRFAALAFAPRDKVLAPFRASLRRVLPQKLPLPR